jgi:alpha-ketoglutarate-dependent taurine dioxygenase
MQIMEIVPSDATLGARIHDVDLHHLDKRTSDRIIAAWHEYGVLAFPAQHLDDEAHITFSRRFGNLERLLTTAIEGTKPEIFRVANIRPDGTIDTAGGAYDTLNRGNQQWHSDSSYNRITSKASALRAQTLPLSGDETQFADIRAAYYVSDDCCL